MLHINLSSFLLLPFVNPKHCYLFSLKQGESWFYTDTILHLFIYVILLLNYNKIPSVMGL